MVPSKQDPGEQLCLCLCRHRCADEEVPLDRQEQMWKRMGVALKRGTMANWVIQVADLYLRPFWKRIRSELLTQSTIHADKTVMQVHKENGRPDTS